MRILTIILMTFLLQVPLFAHAADWCTRPDRIDPEVPAGLTGTYDLVGKDASGGTYSGELIIGEGARAYTLKRKVASRTVSGEAWIERCGPDRITFLRASYTMSPRVLELHCALGNDGDNYYRITCRTHYRGTPQARQGLEAMFQRQ